METFTNFWLTYWPAIIIVTVFFATSAAIIIGKWQAVSATATAIKSFSPLILLIFSLIFMPVSLCLAQENPDQPGQADPKVELEEKSGLGLALPQTNENLYVIMLTEFRIVTFEPGKTPHWLFENWEKFFSGKIVRYQWKKTKIIDSQGNSLEFFNQNIFIREPKPLPPKVEM